MARKQLGAAPANDPDAATKKYVDDNSGAGDVVGPASSTDEAIARFDSTTGKLLQNSTVVIDNTGNMSLNPGTLSLTDGFGTLTLTNQGGISASGATLDLSCANGISLYGSASSVTILGASSGAASLRLSEDTDNGTNYVSLTAPSSVASNKTITFPDATTTVVGTDTTDTLTNKTIDANGTGNAISNLEVADFASGVIDTDVVASVSGSHDTIPTAKAVFTALGGKQTLDADLTSWAALTRASGFDTFVVTPSGANLATLLTSALPASKGGTGLTALSANIVSLLGAADYSAAFTLLKQAASDSATGVVELATTTETTTGTDATRAVTPDGLHDMTSLAGAAWFLDEDNMASDSATKTASQQSIKKYVDDNLGTNSIISDETPSGSVNSSNTTFTTANDYIAGTLEVYVNGLKQYRTTHFTETTPSTGTFTMGTAPTTDDVIRVTYQFIGPNLGNADTVDGYHGDDLMPVGSLIPYAGDTVPTGNWLFCYGQSLLRADYPTLFTRLGTTYGSADGTHFNLPDLRGRTIAGQDDMGASSANRLTGLSGGVDGDTLGATGGAETATNALSDSSYAQAAPSESGGNSFMDARTVTGVTSYDATVRVSAAGTGDFSGRTVGIPLRGTTDAGNNVQPTIILNYMIKAL